MVELENPANDLWYSPISVWEILLLAEKGRMSIGKDSGKSIRALLQKLPLLFLITLQQMQADLHPLMYDVTRVPPEQTPHELWVHPVFESKLHAVRTNIDSNRLEYPEQNALASVFRRFSAVLLPGLADRTRPDSNRTDRQSNRICLPDRILLAETSGI